MDYAKACNWILTLRNEISRNKILILSRFSEPIDLSAEGKIYLVHSGWSLSLLREFNSDEDCIDLSSR